MWNSMANEPFYSLFSLFLHLGEKSKLLEGKEGMADFPSRN
jgi:hypothetical protein